ncbi:MULTISPECIES: 1-phosphofructokinase [Ruminococcus]|jgi:1-phosphofructokinase|uniref:Tagatose-6-phosphate kinase n=1 Tax=Ruminococcus bovis TaxID=2564099 RepID=A0A4P8XSM5_9FIRM|nr:MULTISPECIES: 1-phosphofructokinase [Ruminococcus]MEE3438500.1 1-phosphofructokinase [Ruminococcus sp.]QCT05915.1 1-phosphofructokinase [Ruminococcus bovis]
MIYTVTFNPAIDYVVELVSFNIGEINRTTREYMNLGGKGVNVSRVLTNLEVPNVALGFVAGFTGDALRSGLERMGVKTDFINLEEGNTRINVNIKGVEETDINARGPEIPNSAIDELFKKLDNLQSGDTLVLAGSIPTSLPNDMYERIMERLYGKGIRFVVDATRDLLVKSLKYEPFLIKPNNHELGEIFGLELTTDNEIIYYARELKKQGAKNVLISMAGDGAILVDENDVAHKIGTPKGKVKNSVGAGDSMVAGFCAGYLEKGDYKYALRMGTAAGSASAFSESLATKQEVIDLLNKI